MVPHRIVPIRIALYTFSKPLLAPANVALERQSFRQKLKGWFSPPLVAVPIGLVLYVTGWELPEIIGQAITWIASVCSPLGMILCGVSLGKIPLNALLRKRSLLLGFLRCLVLPGVMLSFCFILDLKHELARPIVICSALPIASMMATFTIQYDPDPEAHFESAGAVLISTILAVATIPFWAWTLTLI